MKAILNQVFAITLESNPTTGYRWEAKFDRAFIELKNRDLAVSNPRSIGAGGVETFNFIPLKAGETKIIMSYQRPWEGKPAEEKSFHVTISEGV